MSDNVIRSSTSPNIPQALRRLLPNEGSTVRLLIIVIALGVGLSLARPATFPTGQNFASMAFQASEVGILTLAIMLTMLTGGIDLSVNATSMFTAILAALVLQAMVPADASAGQVALGFTLAISAALAAGVLCGLLNGFLIAVVGITPILATLGTLTLYTGFSTAISRGASVFGVDQFQFIGNGYVIGIPFPLIIFAVCAALLSVVLKRTAFGLKVYMLGTNPVASRFSGVDNRAILLQVYTISGLLSALAGLVVLGRTNAASPDFGASYILLAILIAVLGGVNPYGGSGRVAGVVLAVIAVQFLSTGVNQLLFRSSGANFFKEFAWGAVLLLVLLGNYFSAWLAGMNKGRGEQPREAGQAPNG